MGFDFINQNGDHWYCNNVTWVNILTAAYNASWKPAGTILYKPSGRHPDLKVLSEAELKDSVTFIGEPPGDTDPEFPRMSIVILEGTGDRALAFEHATRNGEIDPNWDGGYGSNDGQIITATDAATLAAALKHSLEAEEDKEWIEFIQELIKILEAGRVMIL
jgi:hypothetical protein